MKKTSKITKLILATLISVVILGSCKKKDDSPTPAPTSSNSVVITDDGNGIGTQTWTADKTYLLDGFCFVNSGQTLTIEPGTVIKGKPGQGADASALIIAQGGKIMAEGTAAKPIIFTAEADDLNGSVDFTARGLWGGVILLGNAQVNTSPSTQQIEGIPTTEARGAYGGTNDADNSGVLKYVSIRHGGTDIGAGNEINGLTLGAVGSGTVIDYIEILSNSDDGIECFGGKPNIKHVLVSNCADDGLDYDQGFRGNVQFYCVLGAPDGNRCGEHDGGTTPEDGTPYAIPTIYNVTYIGVPSNDNCILITFRDNAGGYYYNSIFVNCPKGIDIEKLASGEDAYNRFSNQQLKIENNVFYNIAGQTTLSGNENSYIYASGDSASIANNNCDATLASYFSTAHNTVADPGISATNPVPANAQTSDLATYPATTFFDNVAYKGAFGSTNWAQGWTATFPNN